MNIPYEMFLTIQMHLTCRKDHIHSRLQAKKDETCSKEQVTTIQEIIQDKEEYDDTFKEFKRPQTQCSYVTLLSDIIDADPSSYERKGRRVIVQEE